MPLPMAPPKTTFGGPNSREGRRIATFLEQIGGALAPWMDHSISDLGIELDIGLPEGTDLLTGNDLDNYLEPLAKHLDQGRLVSARASKRHGAASQLALGSVSSDGLPPLHGWSFAVGRAEGLSENGRRQLGRQVGEQASPAPWGPVEMEVAIRTDSARDWVATWKPVIDSLAPILGRAYGKREFDIEDGRIVRLALHREVEPGLGHAVEVGVWWRVSASLAPSVGSGPALSYEVRADQTARGPSSSRAPSLAGRPPSAHRSKWPRPGMRLITDLRALQDIQARASGYVVITDTANPPRLHRAGCPAIKERYFETKVLTNEMRTGAYVAVADAQTARHQWPGLRPHSCVDE